MASGSRPLRRWLKEFLLRRGCLSGFYSALLDEFKDKPPKLRLRAVQLPVPEDLEMPSHLAATYARLAVSYGLSFDPFDIGKIKPASEIKDIPKEPKPRFGDSYIGKEHT